MWSWFYVAGRDETIQYIDILQYLLLHYYTIMLKNISILQCFLSIVIFNHYIVKMTGRLVT